MLQAPDLLIRGFFVSRDAVPEAIQSTFPMQSRNASGIHDPYVMYGFYIDLECCFWQSDSEYWT